MHLIKDLPAEKNSFEQIGYKLDSLWRENEKMNNEGFDLWCKSNYQSALQIRPWHSPNTDLHTQYFVSGSFRLISLVFIQLFLLVKFAFQIK